jgi:hypothetical protein
MTRHIAGFVLFSFIVSVSGVIAFIFADIPQNIVPQPEIYTVKNAPKYEGKYRCDKKDNYTFSSDVSVKVAQSVFNKRTGLIDTNLYIERKDFSTNSVAVALHFFAKNNDGARFIATENFYSKPDFNRQNKAVLGIPSRSYQWLDDLNPNENLYVIADADFRNVGNRKFQPDFDETKAFSVISLKGR